MATGEDDKEPVGVGDGCVTSWLVDESQDQEWRGWLWCSYVEQPWACQHLRTPCEGHVEKAIRGVGIPFGHDGAAEIEK